MSEFEAIGERLKYKDNGFTCRRAEEIIKIQFVGTEIVRCKDCVCQRSCIHAQYLGDDGFCSRGVRKDGGENG